MTICGGHYVRRWVVGRGFLGLWALGMEVAFVGSTGGRDRSRDISMLANTGG